MFIVALREAFFQIQKYIFYLLSFLLIISLMMTL